MFCTECGSELLDQSAFCSRCGVRVEMPPQRSNRQRPGAGTSSRTFLILLGIVLLTLSAVATVAGLAAATTQPSDQPITASSYDLGPSFDSDPDSMWRRMNTYRAALPHMGNYGY
jgi:hypothetical protein